MSSNSQPKPTQQQKRKQNGQRYSTIDLHLDRLAAGETNQHPAPFIKRAVVTLTDVAKEILKTANG